MCATCAMCALSLKGNAGFQCYHLLRHHLFRHHFLSRNGQAIHLLRAGTWGTVDDQERVHDLGKEQYLLAYPEALADDDCNMQ